MSNKGSFFGQLTAAAVAAVAFGASACAHEGPVPHGVPHLDHVFVIMMENHGYLQVFQNPNEPYLNGLIASKAVAYATNYFGVGHPSLTNYLEVVGGSNFGVRSDHYPLWHNATCVTNLASRVPNADNNAGTATFAIDNGRVCPIGGTGADAATDAVDNWNEVTPVSAPGVKPVVYNFLADIDGVKAVAQSGNIDGMTIADQLARAGRRWKSYQENLPLAGADGVDDSNGTATQASNFTPNTPGTLAPLTSASIVAAYAAKHDPFVYFRSVQDGTIPGGGFSNIVGFDGPKGLYADLATGHVPDFALLAPNQCNDQHGRGNADAFCGFDFASDGLQAGLNPGLIAQGDATIERLVTSIKASPAWETGRSAIVIVWDENDYSGISPLGAFAPQHTNNVLLTVETSYAGTGGAVSHQYYNHFSLLRTIEAALGLPCLNHACDADVKVMADLFGGERQ